MHDRREADALPARRAWRTVRHHVLVDRESIQGAGELTGVALHPAHRIELDPPTREGGVRGLEHRADAEHAHEGRIGIAEGHGPLNTRVSRG